MKIGDDTLIEPYLYASTPKVEIGRNCYIGVKSYFDAWGGITIEDNVSIGAYVKLLTRDHPIADGPVRHIRAAENNCDLPIWIGSGCWLGANVTVLPGVKIGRASVVAAGAVVVTDVESDTLYAGVPAIRKRILG